MEARPRAGARRPVVGLPVLSRGSAGDDVRQVQTLLLVDGLFGAATEAAVKAYQKAHGLVADGIVGPYTWRALLGADADAESWQTGITATVFGGSADVQRSAYDEHVITDSELAVALPYRFTGTRPRVEVRGRAARPPQRSRTGGPHNINDPYWEDGSRPLAEMQHASKTVDQLGRVPTNPAGIDLSPALARAVGVDGLGKVDWRLI